MQNNEPFSRLILGIDPGTNVMGYALVGITTTQKMQCKALGVVKFPTQKEEDNVYKLAEIYKSIQQLLQQHQATELAIEAPFYGKNIQSMLKLGRAQGVVIAACIAAGMTVTEYMPKKIKMSITGNGNASKEQVAKMLEQVLKIKIDNKYLDASDALGVAVCHFFQHPHQP